MAFVAAAFDGDALCLVACCVRRPSVSPRSAVEKVGVLQ